jgi:hypothetical protein
MVVNAIAPFEGKLIWVGTPNGGNTQSGEEWKSVEFVISYTDGKLQERNICLNAFGVDRVNRILSTPLGTMLRVTFQPTARQYNEKWYGKNEVFGITVIQPQAQPQQPAPQYPPQYPVQGTQMPPQTPAYQAPVYQQPVQPAPQGFPAGLTAEDDIPF